VTLRGRLDTATAPELEAELAPVLDRPDVTSLVFRLDGLEYLSSAGIRCVIRARQVIEGRAGRVALVNAQAAVLKVLQIVKAFPADRIFASPAELDAARDSVEPEASRPR
jgi:anti-anti-sigma factor